MERSQITNKTEYFILTVPFYNERIIKHLNILKEQRAGNVLVNVLLANVVLNFQDLQKNKFKF